MACFVPCHTAALPRTGERTFVTRPIRPARIRPARSAFYWPTHADPMRRADVYHSDPDILGGTPVFVGTRVPIDTLLVYLRKGKRIEDFRDDFPTVSREQSEALLELAGRDLVAEA